MSIEVTAVKEGVQNSQVVRFATFEVDLLSGELRKAGVKLKLTGQPFQVLAILLEHPGQVVTRDELQKRLWPDTFVDVDHNLNTAINKIREVLGDSSENPRFVETLPRRGYRFVAPVESNAQQESKSRPLPRRALLVGVGILLAVAGLVVYKQRQSPVSPVQRALTRLTFDEGLQSGATWSPDGRYIAYSSDRGGKFDIWVQQVSGGDPIQVTKGPGHSWQPDWSPDGKFIAYRSEAGDGGLFIIPTLGGVGSQREISSFGYFPQWSPDGTQILFRSHFSGLDASNHLYVAGIDGRAPHELFAGDASHYALFKDLDVFSVAWCPDGKRITLWAWSHEPAPSFWIVPIVGGSPVKLEIPAAIIRQLNDVSAGPASVELKNDWKFSWNPSGTAIYFARKFRGTTNIWRMTVNPQTLMAVALERLTTGPGLDADLSLSRDGRNLAFTGRSSFIRARLFSFDANRGTVSGPGQAVTSVGIEAWNPDLSPDGKRIACWGLRAGKSDLWEKLIDLGPESPVAPDLAHVRNPGKWSPDSTQLAYSRIDLSTGQSQIVKWSNADHAEVPVTSLSTENWQVDQWSPDGRSLLATHFRRKQRTEIWQIPLDARPAGESTPRKLISDPSLDLYQAHFSPDGQWISFLAVNEKPNVLELTIYVTPSAGGKWIRITDGKHWDDKPRWSPDGKSIYFVSNRAGFFNVWGLHFDPVKGQAIGDAFQVTSFNRPNLMVPNEIPFVGFSLGLNRLAITTEEASGSIWILNHVDP